MFRTAQLLSRLAPLATRATEAQVSGLMRSSAQLRSLHATAAANKVIHFMLADIGEGIAEAELLAWHVQPGDMIEEFGALCDVQSDKASVDITSRYSGKIVKLHYDVGDMAIVGKPLVDIDVPEEELEGTHHHEAPVEESSGSQSSSGEDVSQTEEKSSQKPSSGRAKALMTPAVRRLIKEHNISLDAIHGTGKDGRVLKEDVLAFLENRAPGQGAAAASQREPSTTGGAASPDPSQPAAGPAVSLPPTLQEDVVKPIRGIQRQMVKSMNQALKVPHFGYADEMVMDKLMALRTRLKPMAVQRDIKLSYMPFFIKAASLALKQFPELNSHVNDDCSEMIVRASHNIGVAMDTPSGLVVPNIKDVQHKTIWEVAAELNRLQGLGASGKLSTSDITGGTFTLSNIGIIGGLDLHPVIFVPEVAIGAMGKVSRVPRFDENDNVVPTHVIKLSFSADHRVIDGVTIAKFFTQMRQYVEDPETMILDMV